jgi:hypothetical protein
LKGIGFALTLLEPVKLNDIVKVVKATGEFSYFPGMPMGIGGHATIILGEKFEVEALLNFDIMAGGLAFDFRVPHLTLADLASIKMEDAEEKLGQIGDIGLYDVVCKYAALDFFLGDDRYQAGIEFSGRTRIFDKEGYELKSQTWSFFYPPTTMIIRKGIKPPDDPTTYQPPPVPEFRPKPDPPAFRREIQ